MKIHDISKIRALEIELEKDSPSLKFNQQAFDNSLTLCSFYLNKNLRKARNWFFNALYQDLLNTGESQTYNKLLIYKEKLNLTDREITEERIDFLDKYGRELEKMQEKFLF